MLLDKVWFDQRKFYRRTVECRDNSETELTHLDRENGNKSGHNILNGEFNGFSEFVWEYKEFGDILWIEIGELIWIDSIFIKQD